MKLPLIAIVVILIGGGLGWWVMRASNEMAAPSLPTRDAPAERVVVAAPAAAVPPLPRVDFPGAPPSELARDAGVRALAAVSLKAAGAAVSAAELAELKLDRQLSGEHTFTMNGRLNSVLGTKGANGSSQTLLVTRDQLSGQITYSLSALQFTLNGGFDAEAFIAEHPRMHKRFVNPLYLQVDVDAADIAAELASALRDSRVATVGLMVPPAVKTPR